MRVRVSFLRTAFALVAATGLAVVVANRVVTHGASARIHRAIADVPQRTVAIVPGARVYADGTPSPILVDRLEAARVLYATGRVRRILVSGDHARPEYNEVGAMHRWLVAHGVPDEAVFLDHAGFRTLDPMVRAAKVFGVRDAVVCTQRFHLARSLMLAEGAGIDAVGFVADRRTYPSRRADATRELFARAVAMLDRYVFATQPRFLGTMIPIDGDALATRDE